MPIERCGMNGAFAAQCAAADRRGRQSVPSVSMPNFYFHIRDGDALTEDPEGSDLPDLEAARAEALTAVRQIAAEGIRTGKRVLGKSMEITDEAGRVLATVAFLDVVGLR